MPQQDTKPTKDKILEVLRKRGPSLPIHIASETGLSMLFASAFLGELLSNNQIKISHMKVGSSPIYLIPGEEPKIEKYSQYLKSKEKDAFLLLKEKRFLEDSKQEPAIRVALREIKDFAIAFQREGQIIWRYFIISESEYKQSAKSTETPLQNRVEHPSNKPDNNPKKLDIFDKKQETEPKTSEPIFIPKVLDYLQRSNIKLIEKTEVKKREFLGIGRIESDLGEMEVLLIGKDKKKITEKDLEKILEKIKENNRMVLLFTNGEIDKKAKEYYRKIKNLIYLKNIE